MRTLKLIACLLSAAAYELVAQVPMQTSTDGFITLTYVLVVNAAPGQALTIPFSVQGLPGTTVNVMTISSCAFPGLVLQNISPQFQSVSITTVTIVTVSFEPAQVGSYRGTCDYRSGTRGGGDNQTVTTKPITVSVANNTPQTAASFPGSTFISHPIAMFTGELVGEDERSYLVQNGPAGLGLTLFYGSYLKANNVSTALGNNWMHNFDLKLTATASSATVRLFRGKTVAFTRSGAAWQLSSNEHVAYQLQSVGTGFQFMSPISRLTYSFDSTGALASVADRNGNTLTVTQGSGGVGPATVSDGVGRTLTFTYTGGNLTRVQDQAGRNVQFENTAGNLTALTDENGKRASYAYGTAGSLTGLLTARTRPAGNKPFSQAFDIQGRVSQQTDAAGNALNLAYNTSSTVATEPQSVAFTHNFDANRNATSIAYAAGANSQYTFDTKNRVTGSTDRTGARRALTYDTASGLPATFTDELNNVTTLRYTASTASGFTFYDLASITYRDGTTQIFTLDAKGNVTAVTDQTGATSRATFTARGQILTVTNATGGVTTFIYGDDGTLASTQSPSGDVAKFGYDAAGRPNQIINADSTSRGTQYDAAGNVTRVTDERSNAIATAYDANGNLLTSTDAVSGVTAFGYDGNDRRIAVTNALGKALRRTFDTVSRVASVTDASGVALTYTYNNQNQLTGIADAAGRIAGIVNDGESRPTSITDGLNRTVTLARSARGQVTTVTTANNEKFTTGYDAMGRVASRTDALGRVTQFRSDRRGRLIGVTYPDGATRSVTRNELGLVSTTTDANGNVSQRTYDKAGRLTGFTDPLSRSYSYTYDSRNRVTSMMMPLGSVQFTYDAAGNRTQVSYSDGTILKYTYDALNRLTATDGVAIQYDAAGGIRQYNGFAFTRDDGGRVTGITYGPGQTTKYTYNNRGLLAQFQDWTGASITFNYDVARQLTSRVYSNGVRMDYTYDANGRPLTLKVTNGAKTLLSETVTRDSLGRITNDAISGITVPEPTGYVSQHFDAANQSYALQYDPMGRVIADGVRSYKWDLAGRLLSYSGADGSATFTYDGLGRVISIARSSQPAESTSAGRDVDPVPIEFRHGPSGVFSVNPTDLLPGPRGQGPLGIVNSTRKFQPTFPGLANSIYYASADGASIADVLQSPFGTPVTAFGNPPPVIGDGITIVDPQAGLKLGAWGKVFSDVNGTVFNLQVVPNSAAGGPERYPGGPDVCVTDAPFPCLSPGMERSGTGCSGPASTDCGSNPGSCISGSGSCSGPSDTGCGLSPIGECRSGECLGDSTDGCGDLDRTCFAGPPCGCRDTSASECGGGARPACFACLSNPSQFTLPIAAQPVPTGDPAGTVFFSTDLTQVFGDGVVFNQTSSVPGVGFLGKGVIPLEDPETIVIIGAILLMLVYVMRLRKS